MKSIASRNFRNNLLNTPSLRHFSQSLSLEEKLKQEKLESPEVIRMKSLELANLIEKSKHFICFTGAGISTSVGIPDYRSTSNTIISTGAGEYEKPEEQRLRERHGIRRKVQSAIPSYTHMALFALQQKGLLKYIVSQNTDGLHLKSGIPFPILTEMHGNVNLEHCLKCERNYLRDYRARTAEKYDEHRTGRRCDEPTCGGELVDQIIHFGEKIPQGKVVAALEQASKADLCLCLGSSLRVKPANQVPIFTAKGGGNVAIVNLQYTPLDEISSLRIHSLCDEVMKHVCETLMVEVPQFELKRRFHIGIKPGTQHFEIFGSSKGQRHSFITRLEVFDQLHHRYLNFDKEPFDLMREVIESDSVTDSNLEFRIHFQGHYCEPYFSLEVPRSSILELQGQEQLICDMTFDFEKMDWISE
ncbi:hypothetical protein FGO68_gene12890 [Halteria grandinella]|uniref:Deacetylase sirtuin-type domain-containing protein n=1 Tax=Halteria grandinella TaxID=5974 RepID=A0A8J8NPJ7_HALGN|nr:hypothetical protein FGO68_gene12890 [Halteria grandinella]